jgi:hypothetical protein
MAAGIPGAGINGVFYTLLVVAAPLREIPRTLAGRSSVARWRAIGKLLVLSAGVVTVLWGEYVLFDKAVAYARERWPNSGWLARSLDAVTPRLAMAPFLILAGVLLIMYALRFVLWLRGRPSPKSA